jgi:hypothetical protein
MGSSLADNVLRQAGSDMTPAIDHATGVPFFTGTRTVTLTGHYCQAGKGDRFLGKGQ